MSGNPNPGRLSSMPFQPMVEPFSPQHQLQNTNRSNYLYETDDYAVVESSSSCVFIEPKYEVVDFAHRGMEQRNPYQSILGSAPAMAVSSYHDRTSDLTAVPMQEESDDDAHSDINIAKSKLFCGNLPKVNF